MIDLLIIVVLSLILIPLAILASGALKIVLGVAFVIFFPGYSLTAALFPKKHALSGMDRLALSFGLSIAVVPLIGLALNYSTWGISLYPILISLLLFIIIASTIAWFRRRRIQPGERFELDLRLSLPAISRSWASQSRLNKTLGILLAIALAGAIGTLVYTVAVPRIGERFTEFYILGPEGSAENYPRELISGEEGRVILHIVNREHETTEYRVEITIDGEKAGEAGTVTLEYEEKWEQEAAFAATGAGLGQKVEFLLYKEKSSEPYQRLHLWIDVRESP